MEQERDVLGLLVEHGICTADDLEHLRVRIVLARRPWATADSPPMDIKQATIGHEIGVDLQRLAKASGGLVTAEELRIALIDEQTLD